MRTIKVLIDHESIPDIVMVEIPDGMTDEEDINYYASAKGLEIAREDFGARALFGDEADAYQESD